MKRRAFLQTCAAGVSLAAPTAGAAPSAYAAAGTDSLRDDFLRPLAQFKTRPLWFWNATPGTEKTAEIMQGSVASGYAGFGILPSQKTPEFMTPEFLAQYRFAVETAERLGLKMCLYDEYWFPSGSAGGALAKQFPEALSQRLDILSAEVKGPSQYHAAAPTGLLMSVGAMNTETLKRVHLTRLVRGGSLTWQVPAGDWKIMWFTCVPDGARGLVDYLEPESVGKFVSLTYEKYYAALAPHFGKTIDKAFYDEPSMHWVKGGRAWTPAFNQKFRRRHGWDPAPYYPALWFDIGTETAAARNALFGFRAELYAEGFVKTLNDWCRAHSIALTGHQDQEEIVNPVGLCGDLMKAFLHQDIPGIDQISAYGRASKAYKVVSSAACNYDNPLVMSECYGAMKDMPVANLYKEAMDQFAKGINWMTPHAVWYDPATLRFPPELSYRSPVYGPALPAYNDYMSRLQRILQQGRHVVDIAVLYPIATLQGGYRFDVGVPYQGGVIPPEADYMDIGEMLALGVRRDFTFLHPETLDGKCEVRGALLHLNNRNNTEDYRVFVMPGSRTIHWKSLEKIKQFLDRGGIVIATTRLPEQSAEFGKDNAVKLAIAGMFEPPAGESQDNPWTLRRSAKGGRAYFLPNPSPEALRTILGEALPDGDVVFEDAVAVSGGNLSYIHKNLDGREVYFFANSSQSPVDCRVRLRNHQALEEWNPHSGAVQPAAVSESRLHVVLPPVQSRFYVGGA